MERNRKLLWIKFMNSFSYDQKFAIYIRRIHIKREIQQKKRTTPNSHYNTLSLQDTKRNDGVVFFKLKKRNLDPVKPE